MYLLEESIMIVECERCHRRYRINRLLFVNAARKVRCSKCRHTFVVDRVQQIVCSICGNENSRQGNYLIREYKGAPYALCRSCAKCFEALLEEVN